ncbi:MAG: PEP-CTERM sorting domain-containing protein [Verrucomicrobiota bacterium]
MVKPVTYAASGSLPGFNLADQSPGDQMTLNSFNPIIAAVPEPVNVALMILGIFMGVLVLVRGPMPRRAWN